MGAYSYVVSKHTNTEKIQAWEESTLYPAVLMQIIKGGTNSQLAHSFHKDYTLTIKQNTECYGEVIIYSTPRHILLQSFIIQHLTLPLKFTYHGTYRYN